MDVRGIFLRQLRDLLVGQQIEYLLLGHQDIVPAAIDCRARLDAHIALATIGIWVLQDIEPANHAPAVQAHLVQPQLLLMEVGLRNEVGGAHHLASEIIVLDERFELASDAIHRAVAVSVPGTHCGPPLSKSRQTHGFANARINPGHRRTSRMRRQHGAAAEPIGVEPDACRYARYDAVQSDHRLHADAETRLDIFDPPSCMRRRLQRQQTFESASLPFTALDACRHEDAELMCIDVKWIAQRIRR